MSVRTYWLTVVCVVKFWAGSVGAESCDVIRSKCATRVGCGMALYNLYLGCNTVMSGESETCTVGCQRALVSLLTTEDELGREFIDCGCTTAYCEPRKRRVQNCSKAVLAAMDSLQDERRIVSCTLAQWICEADTSCYTALNFYLKHCSRMIKGDKCTSRCNNSLNILYRQPKAKKMQTCRCEGDEVFNCYEIRQNTANLCLYDSRYPIMPLKTESHKNANYRNGHEAIPVGSWFTVIVLFLIYTFVYCSQIRTSSDTKWLLDGRIGKSSHNFQP